MKLSVDADRYDPAYCYYYFSSSAGQRQVVDSAIQTGVPHTNLGILKAYRLPVPRDKAEQRALILLDVGIARIHRAYGLVFAIWAEIRPVKQCLDHGKPIGEMGERTTQFSYDLRRSGMSKLKRGWPRLSLKISGAMVPLTRRAFLCASR